MKRRARGNLVKLVNSDGHLVGVDIGATAVRAAAIVRDDDGGPPSIAVHSLGEVALPGGAVVGGVVKDEAVVTAALRTLWSEHGFHCHNVVLGTGNQQVVVRPLEVPTLSAQQQKQALPFLAQDVVALPMEEALLDFAPLADADPDTGMVPGLLIAVPRLPVLAAVRAVQAAGLDVARVDLSSFAALRFVADQNLSVEAVIDLGAHLSSIVIHRGGVPTVVRTVARGGQELTDRLIDRLELSPIAAETLKREQGLLSDGEAGQILREAIRPLLAEVRSSLHFYGTSNPDVELEAISVTGGAAGLPGLVEQLNAQHGVPVQVVSPRAHLTGRWSGRHADFDGPDAGGANITVPEPSPEPVPEPTVMGSDGPRFAGTAVSVGLAMGAAA